MTRGHTSEQLENMRRDWDQRARENARYYVATGKDQWSDEEFRESGRATLREQVLTDVTNICQGMDPKQMKVLEIGCGAGRITSAFAEYFGEVLAVDISAEMVNQARALLSNAPNAHVFHNNGKDLQVVKDWWESRGVGPLEVDFAFTFIVFQHIPSREIIENYVREVGLLLKTGGLFKFQVQGGMETENETGDTWVGASFTETDAREMAERCGFEMRYAHGAGTQYFWLWFFKK